MGQLCKNLKRFMKINKKFLAIVPARSGSKDIKNKNIVKLGKYPLIIWTLIEAQKSKYLSNIIVSTDSIKISKIVEKYKFKVPFLRPKKISQDNSKSIDLVLHALKKIKLKFDYLVLLQPTSPFRSSKIIDECIEIVIKKKIKSLTTVVENNKPLEWIFHIEKNKIKKKFLNNLKSIRRQDARKSYSFNGAVYIVSVSQLIKYKKFIFSNTYLYIMDKINSVDIDDKYDLLFANLIINNKRYINK